MSDVSESAQRCYSFKAKEEKRLKKARTSILPEEEKRFQRALLFRHLNLIFHT